MIDFNEEEYFLSQRQGLDLTSLVDMVFILLLFFLLTSFALQPFFEVELPGAESGVTGDYKGARVRVSADGGLALNGEPVSGGDLGPALRKIHEQDTSLPLSVEADKAAPFGTVMTVMDESRKAGFSALFFPVAAETNEK